MSSNCFQPHILHWKQPSWTTLFNLFIKLPQYSFKLNLKTNCRQKNFNISLLLLRSFFQHFLLVFYSITVNRGALCNPAFMIKFLLTLIMLWFNLYYNFYDERPLWGDNTLRVPGLTITAVKKHLEINKYLTFFNWLSTTIVTWRLNVSMHFTSMSVSVQLLHHVTRLVLDYRASNMDTASFPSVPQFLFKHLFGLLIHTGVKMDPCCFKFQFSNMASPL